MDYEQHHQQQKAREQLISSVFRILEADRAEPHAHADAEREYAGEQLALAARDLTRATEALPAGERPVGWNTPDVSAAQAESWAVLLEESNGTYAYGPFDDKDLADSFAAFVTAEVDPARVVPLAEVGPARPGIVWRSALDELLSWREVVALRWKAER